MPKYPPAFNLVMIRTRLDFRFIWKGFHWENVIIAFRDSLMIYKNNTETSTFSFIIV